MKALTKRFGYNYLYIFNVQKVIRILTIYREWLLSQSSLDFDELYHYSQERENIEYCNNIKEYLNLHPELYPDADVLVEFFGDDSNKQNINLDN